MAIKVFSEATDKEAVGFLHNQDFPFYPYTGEWNEAGKHVVNEERKAFEAQFKGMPKFGPFAYWVKETHKGLCLYDYEKNGYDDSDFCMVVWNEEKQQPEHITFASTRGWTYPLYSSYPDATPEVKAKYEAWKVATARRYNIQNKWNKRKIEIKQAAEMKITRKEWKRLKELYGYEKAMVFYPLLKANLRSQFKKDMANKVREWLAGNSNYKYPLSLGQFEALTRYHGMKW